MAIEVKYTPDFRKQVKRLAGKYKSIYNDLEGLIDDLETTPTLGSPLGKNLYKVRLALSDKGKGKSAGARVITYVFIKNETVYLTAIYDKSDHSTIDTERLIKILKTSGL
ncbi:type II toxin-antitoxin system RelE/ParE family toxin [Mucilaginibacter sp.]|uniref:type II toxin-antitoxin system RelE/ParE family toxin n=1 Tax=Mucilaginibacter sp. TaxID=1882438 RepID=UPI00284CE8F0|nr:type II toxin-antitoxin system RelE/ParE family toxin [Mucilaginibacter sp.]MDR3693969.1 type II toxin-antitoxin system RelE/ParE family toxin [Mucilaginibacter sp.]